MKKNFFKKLSFVLALAMIVSVLAPAAGAFAAKAPKLNASDKTLHLGVDGKDEFDFNISNKVTGWKYKWSSANKDVATVNKSNGITTATGAGKTKVSVVITDKKGEEVAELTATVLVRDNIKELTITNLPEDGKVAVGVAHDFNRSYVTVANKKKGSQAITRWSVSPSEDATITDSGVFTANKAGEYTITARSFQSKAKYTSWLTDATKYASYVTAEATYKVTVASSMVAVKQVNLKKFDVTFDSAMTKEDITKNLTVKYVLGSAKVSEGIKSVSMSADNKTATIETNYDLSKGYTYVVEYPNMKSLEFVAATAKVEDVVDMAIKTTTAQVGKETKLDIALYNKDGVNIANDELLGRVTTEKDANNYAYLVTPLKINMYKLGEVVKVTSTFHTYKYTDGKEVGNVSATAEITCVEVAKEVAGEIYAWTLKDTAVSSAPTNFNKTNNQVFKTDSQQLYVVLKGKDADGNDKYTSNFTYTGTPSATYGPLAWKYTSSNDKVVFVGASGIVYGVSEGTAQVVVSYNDVQVGAVDITVVGTRKAAIAELSTQTLTLSNAFSDPTTISFKVKDQLGNDYKTSGAWNATAQVTYNGSASTNPYTGSGLVFNGAGIAAGTYGYTVKIKDSLNSGVEIPLNFSVTVQDPGSNTAIASYRIEADDTSYDMKSGTSVSSAEVALSVYAYNSAGVKLSKTTVAALESTLGSTIEVRRPNGVTGSGIIVSEKIDLVTTKTVSGRSVVSTAKEGAWVVAASNTNTPGTSATHNKVVYSVGFEVKNTQPKAEQSVKGYITDKVGTSISASNIAALINELVSFSAGDKTLRAETGFLGNDYYIEGNRVTVRKIKLYEDIDGTNFIEHEVDLGGIVLYVK